eukprot:scaffold39744_cov155-Skeletonema_dohrnii-CCMP3373.AAC.2
MRCITANTYPLLPLALAAGGCYVPKLLTSKDLAAELGDVEACLFLFAFPITTNKYDRKKEDGVEKDTQKGSYSSQKEMNERLEF